MQAERQMGFYGMPVQQPWYEVWFEERPKWGVRSEIRFASFLLIDTQF